MTFISAAVKPGTSRVLVARGWTRQMCRGEYTYRPGQVRRSVRSRPRIRRQ